MKGHTTIGANLKTARERCGFSVDYTARMIDVKPKDIEKWERADGLPDEDTLSLLARLYSTDPASLKGEPSAERSAETEEIPRPPKKSRAERSDTDPDAFSAYTARTESDASAQTHSDPKRKNTASHGKSVFDTYLEEGETVLLICKPHPMVETKPIPRSLLLAFFTVVAFGILTFLENNWYEALATDLFLLFVFFISTGFIWIRKIKKCVTHYAITDRRVLMYSPLSFEKCVEKRYTADFHPLIRQGTSGFGTIFFDSTAYLNAGDEGPIEAEESFRIYGGRSGKNRILHRYRKSLPDPLWHLVDIKDPEEVLRILKKAAAIDDIEEP